MRGDLISAEISINWDQELGVDVILHTAGFRILSAYCMWSILIIEREIFNFSLNLP